MAAPSTTKAREAIYTALAEAEGPLTAVQIRMAFTKKVRPGIATVYRAVNAGVRDGLLKEVPLGDGTMRFKPADRGTCESCT